MAKRGNIIKKMTSWKIILFIQCIASILFLGIIYRLGILPMRYYCIVIAVAALLWLLSFSLMKPSKVSRKRAFGKFISILLSIILVFVSLRIAQGDSLLYSFTRSGEEVTRISLIVMDESPYESIDDLDNCVVETSLSLDKANMEDVIDLLKEANSTLYVQTITVNGSFNTLTLFEKSDTSLTIS